MPRNTEVLAEEIRIETPSPAPAFRPAPTHDEVRAYWAPGRAIDEAQRMMEAYKSHCATCGAELYYIPQPGEEAVPADLLCQEHGHQPTA